MNFTINPLNYEERKYTFAQSQQLRGQTGSIGRLRGDFGSDGNGFYTTWEDHSERLNTTEFKNELDKVINELRSKSCGLLTNLNSMRQFMRQNPDSAMKGSYTTEYGFRVNTEKYSYLLRCNHQKGDYNFYCFCYLKDLLDNHILNARKDIRFITSNYKDLFRLPDGESIRITNANGEWEKQPCRYIDEYHLEVGYNLFHICEFAEKMESSHSTYCPAEPTLPPISFSLLPSSGEVIKITRYQKGYTPMNVKPDGESKHFGADPLNEALNVSKAQAAAMLAGSMFGWDCPASKVKSYDHNGKAIYSKDKER